ncbi:hypothetical protein CI1B_84080 [Bradyrhizobium ivorense]|uniref:Uncharacterized protein n=1 Tax=Bradyrhizobium ivorense TaxID=2511166 RepID=A0A508U202_9BRAD|nr:hypothetical protein CI1B_84080 [Bradyrhizobium ivorense]
MRMPGANLGYRLHGTSGISPVAPKRGLVPSASTQAQVSGRSPRASGTKHSRQPVSRERVLDVLNKPAAAFGIPRKYPVELRLKAAKRWFLAALDREAFFRAVAVGGGFLSAALMAYVVLADR